jgi:hypothetical protein
MIKKLNLTVLAFFSLIATSVCQETSQDFLRSTGKIYVVVAVIAVIFFILIGFLVYLERRISKLEKNS